MLGPGYPKGIVDLDVPVGDNITQEMSDELQKRGNLAKMTR
jgi:hypothetical protein